MRTEENNTNNNSIFDSEIEKILIEKDRIISQLSLKNEELSGKNEELSGKNEELSGKNEYLLYQIAQLKRMLFGSKRERFVPNENQEQLTIPFEVEVS